MTIVKATVKGQVIIPAPLRKKYSITKGARLSVEDRRGEIVIRPLMRDPIAQAKGMLKGGRSALKELMRERARDAKQ